MKYLNVLFLIVGFGLLGFIVREMDAAEVWRQVVELGWWGMVFVLTLYTVAFLISVVGWLLTFKTVPMTSPWMGRLYLVRMAGEAFNNVTPLGSVGGEPVKALMLKHRYGLGYREVGVSLILDKTVVAIGLALFLSVGFVLLMPSERLEGTFKTVSGLGLAALSTGILLFFLIQRFRIASWVGQRLGGSRFGARLGRVLRLVGDVDERIVRFYTVHWKRFAAALSLALVNWTLGAVEVYAVMWWLGQPVTLVDAWGIEAMAQLVRTGTFFIPAGLGTQDGTFVFVCSAITGNAPVGLAMSVVRRCREIVWILTGLALWWVFAPRPGVPAKEPAGLPIEDQPLS